MCATVGRGKDNKITSFPSGLRKATRLCSVTLACLAHPGTAQALEDKPSHNKKEPPAFPYTRLHCCCGAQPLV